MIGISFKGRTELRNATVKIFCLNSNNHSKKKRTNLSDNLIFSKAVFIIMPSPLEFPAQEI